MPIITISVNNNLKNLNYLIYCSNTRDCCVIDPLDAECVLQTAHENHLKIISIINTHEHGDHTGGNKAVKEKTGAEICAHHQAQALIPGFDRGVKAGDTVQVGKSIELSILETPGHTMHSICIHDKQNAAIFTGDTLFNCGCGNCYNGGNPGIMFETFEKQLQHLPDETKLYPGHDYIRNNLKFAKSLQPDLPAIQLLEQKISDNDIYVSTLGEDKTVDPFFRLEDTALIQALHHKIHLSETPTRKEVFLALRELRNAW